MENKKAAESIMHNTDKTVCGLMTDCGLSIWKHSGRATHAAVPPCGERHVLRGRHDMRVRMFTP